MKAKADALCVIITLVDINSVGVNSWILMFPRPTFRLSLDDSYLSPWQNVICNPTLDCRASSRLAYVYYGEFSQLFRNSVGKMS